MQKSPNYSAAFGFDKNMFDKSVPSKARKFLSDICRGNGSCNNDKVCYILYITYDGSLSQGDEIYGQSLEGSSLTDICADIYIDGCITFYAGCGDRVTSLTPLNTI